MRDLKKINIGGLFFGLSFLMSSVSAVPADDVACTGCVGTTDIALGAVTGGRLSPNAVTTVRIKDGEVKTQDLAVGAVTTGKLAPSAVTSVRIKDGAVNTQDLTDKAVTYEKMADSVVRVPQASSVNQMLYWNTTNNNWIAKAPPSLATDANMQPWLGVNYIIATTGTYPSRSGVDPYLAEISLFGGNFAPRGWALCDGQLLAISSNSALFSLLGTTYGGDGRTTFALPDLRGRVAIHPGTGPGLSSRSLGQRGGNQNINLNY